MSRVPITPPSSSTGTLKAAHTPSPTSTWANPAHSGSTPMSPMAAGSRWLNATAHGPLGQPFLPVLDRLGGLVRRAGPAQLPFGVDQHQPGGVGPEQLLGRVGDLLQGRGQARPRIQAAQGTDALGQIGRVDRHALPPFRYGLTGYCWVLDATTGHASPARPAPTGQRRPASRSHRDALVGSTVWPATASNSPVRVSRSTSSRSRALNAWMVLAAS